MKTQTSSKTSKAPRKIRAVSVDESLRAGLTDPAEAAAYIEACLKEKGELRSKLLLRALMDIAKAHGMSRLAGGSESRRRGIYKALIGEANPSLQTLMSILEKLGLEIAVRPQRKTA